MTAVTPPLNHSKQPELHHRIRPPHVRTHNRIMAARQVAPMPKNHMGADHLQVTIARTLLAFGLNK